MASRTPGTNGGPAQRQRRSVMCALARVSHARLPVGAPGLHTTRRRHTSGSAGATEKDVHHEQVARPTHANGPGASGDIISPSLRPHRRPRADECNRRKAGTPRHRGYTTTARHRCLHSSPNHPFNAQATAIWSTTRLNSGATCSALRSSGYRPYLRGS